MKTHALIAALALALPGVADARKITYYSDRDGDGHYVKRTKNVPDYRHHHGYRSGYRGHYGGYYGSRYRYGGYPYYGSRYGYPYYSGPSLSFVYSSTPRYYTSRSYVRPSYRAVADSLEVDVQRELKRKGYYRGPIDGDIGPGSRAAIRAYQADRRLAITGRIDAALLRSLGI